MITKKISSPVHSFLHVVAERYRFVGLLSDRSHPLCTCAATGAIAVGDFPRILIFDKVRNFSSPRVVELRDEFLGAESLCFSGDGSRLIGGMDDGSVVSFDCASGEVVEVLTRHEEWVHCVSVSFDAGIVVSGSDDRTVRVCGGIGVVIEERRAHRAVGIGHTKWVRGVALLKGEETFVSGSHDGTLRLWDLECNCLRVVEVGRYVLSLALSPCGSQVAVGQLDGFVTLFGTETWDEVWEEKVHAGAGPIYSVSYHGRYIATGSNDRTAKILDSETGRVIRSLEKGHSDFIMHVSFTSCGTSLLTTSCDNDKNLLKWPLFPKETLALASFFDASGIETLLYEEDGVLDFEEARSEVFKLASREIIPRIKRVLFLEMEEGVVDGRKRVQVGKGKGKGSGKGKGKR